MEPAGDGQRTMEDKGDTLNILTTTPIPPPSMLRSPIYTPRLILRPVRAHLNRCGGRASAHGTNDGDDHDDDDILAINTLHNQPSVMRWMAAGPVVESLDQTREFLRRFVEPNDTETFIWAIVLRRSIERKSSSNGKPEERRHEHESSSSHGTDQTARRGETLSNRTEAAGSPSAHPRPGMLEAGTVVGLVGGMNLRGPEGWPKLGYLLREETWGLGLASEAVSAYMNAYWALPRRVLRTSVTQASLPDEMLDADSTVPERLIGVTKADNVGSCRILEKVGMQMYEKTFDPNRKGGMLAKFSMVRPGRTRDSTIV